MLKVNVGLSKKMGQENYGSKGCSINVDLELDASLVNEPQKLREKIRQMFGLVRASIEEELNSGGHAPTATNGNGRHHDEGGGNGYAHADRTAEQTAKRPSTNRQQRAIASIARAQKVRLPELLREQFGVGDVTMLSLEQASDLIDSLRSGVTNGTHR